MSLLSGTASAVQAQPEATAISSSDRSRSGNEPSHLLRVPSMPSTSRHSNASGRTMTGALYRGFG